MPRADGRRPDARVPDPPVRDLHGLADPARPRPAHRGPPRGGPVRRDGHPGDVRGHRRLRSPWRSPGADGPAAAAGRLWRERAASWRASRSVSRTCRPRSRRACASALRTCAAATRRSPARSPSGGFNIAILWASFHAFGARAADLGDRDGLLRRDARQPAAAAGWRRRGRRRDDRRVRRRSASTSAWRPSRCSPTADSRSGCRPSRARSPTSSCARPSSGGARSAARAELAAASAVTRRNGRYTL